MHSNNPQDEVWIAQTLGTYVSIAWQLFRAGLIFYVVITLTPHVAAMLDRITN